MDVKAIVIASVVILLMHILFFSQKERFYSIFYRQWSRPTPGPRKAPPLYPWMKLSGRWLELADSKQDSASESKSSSVTLLSPTLEPTPHATSPAGAGPLRSRRNYQ